jgi:hypothetical protein
MERLVLGQTVRLDKYRAIGVVSAIRGRSNPAHEGDSGYVQVTETTGVTHVTPGTSLFVWASDVEEVR